jgi:hypothetical protein
MIDIKNVLTGRLDSASNTFLFIFIQKPNVILIEVNQMRGDCIGALEH